LQDIEHGKQRTVHYQRSHTNKAAAKAKPGDAASMLIKNLVKKTGTKKATVKRQI
jgi:hypothetical protein